MSFLKVLIGYIVMWSDSLVVWSYRDLRRLLNFISLIYFAETNDHAIPFFVNAKIRPLHHSLYIMNPFVV